MQSQWLVRCEQAVASKNVKQKLCCCTPLYKNFSINAFELHFPSSDRKYRFLNIIINTTSIIKKINKTIFQCTQNTKTVWQILIKNHLLAYFDRKMAKIILHRNTKRIQQTAKYFVQYQSSVRFLHDQTTIFVFDQLTD